MTDRMPDPMIVPFEGHVPRIDEGAFVAPGAVLIGRVHLKAGASVWYGCILRGDNDDIVIGDGSNLQDGCILHTDVGRPLVVGARVSVGHGAIVHGATIGDDVLIGMRATLLNGASVDRHGLVAAGALVPPGMDVAAGSMVAGVPARRLREVRDEEIAMIERTALSYQDKSVRHAAAVAATGAGSKP